MTATDSALVFPDWPLMGGTPHPAARPMRARPTILHRWVAAIVGVIVAVVAVAAVRTQRAHPADRAAGRRGRGVVRHPDRRRWPPGPHPAVRLDPDAPPGPGRDHLGDARRARRRELLHGADAQIVRHAEPGSGGASASPGAPGAPRTRSDSVRAYIALTKPRIIELLLVTTVPAMVLATRWVPGLDWGDGAGSSSGRCSAARSRPAARTPSTATSTATSTCS